MAASMPLRVYALQKRRFIGPSGSSVKLFFTPLVSFPLYIRGWRHMEKVHRAEIWLSLISFPITDILQCVINMVYHVTTFG